MTTITEKEMFERYIIAGLLTDYDNLIDYMKIQPSDLDNPYKEILSTMKSEGTGDSIILSSKIPGITSDFLFELASEVIYTNPSDFQKYVETLKDIIDRSKIIRTLESSILNIKGLGSMRETYLSIHNEFMKTEDFNGEDINNDIKEVLNEANGESTVKIIRTGYRDLDNLIGGFEKGQIIVIGARPGIGKSMMAINLMVNNAIMGEKVALFSMEMLNKQIIRRLLSIASGISVWQLKTKLEGEDLENLNKGYDKLKGWIENMHFIDNCGTIGEIEGKIRYLAHKEHVSVVYIDYLQLIRNPQIKNNPVESITDISQRLKQLALQLGITIVELSQLNRDADRTMVKKASQLRGSGSIEQDADMVWLLDKDDDSSDKINLSVQKCRDGRIGEIRLIQASDIMQISNMPTPF